jgi:endonuclease I
MYNPTSSCVFFKVSFFLLSMSSKYVGRNTYKPLIYGIYGKTNRTSSIEHVVPKFYLKHVKDQRIKNDIHNLILIPKIMNNQRGIKKYGDDEKETYVPDNKYKGMIARSAAYMSNQYPTLKTIIWEKVIDKETAMLWNKMYPPKYEEKIKCRIAENYQGIPNIFVKNYTKFIEGF